MVLNLIHKEILIMKLLKNKGSRHIQKTLGSLDKFSKIASSNRSRKAKIIYPCSISTV
jgi:3-polyprenyl-4-hydroxybenzoate decarboxylase